MLLKRPIGYRARTQAARKLILQKILLVAILLTLLALIPALYLNLRNRGGNERRELRDFFETGAFEVSHAKSREMLEEAPLDFFLLTLNGYSAYQLAVAQINSYDTLSFLEECIISLRQAMLLRNSPPELYYVLGKAYYHKGEAYADLAVYYLEKARDASFTASDIPEYLGLSYAALGDYRSSIEAFSSALNASYDTSDVLLLSIAHSYMALEDYEASRDYLARSINVSRDSKIITTSRLLLAGILYEAGEFSSAEEEYNNILGESGENAEAYFMLGEIYLAQGETTRARAEWRRAIRTDAAYRPARARLNLQ